MAELGLVKNIVPDDIGNEVADCLNGFLYVSSILLNLRSNELHNCIASLLARLQKQSWCHFVDKTAEGLDLTILVLGLNSKDSLLELVEKIGGNRGFYFLLCS